MKRNIFILALVAMFVSATISAQTTETKKVETKKECCKSKDDKKACADKKDKKACADKKACCSEKKK